MFHNHHQGLQHLDAFVHEFRVNPVYLDGRLRNAVSLDLASSYSFDAVVEENRWIGSLTPLTEEPRWLRTGDGTPGLTWP